MAGVGELLSGTRISSEIATKSAQNTAQLNRTSEYIRQAAGGTQSASVGVNDTSLAMTDDILAQALGVVLQGMQAVSPLAPLFNTASLVMGKEDKSSTDLLQTVKSLQELIEGKAAKLQLEAILKDKITPDMTLTNGLFEQMAFITDLSAVISAASMAAEVASVGQIDRIGNELRSYLDYSGVSQLVGFGYGQILSEALGESLKQEIRGKIQNTLIPVSELIISQFRRDNFNPQKPAFDNDILEQLRKYGFSDDNAQTLLNANLFYPGVVDWLRFAVRDVFNAEAVATGGYDENFPEDILPHTRKAGITDEAVRWYWRAHWELPSPTLGYEMLHRRIISQDELESLLRTADYAPNWIPKMIEAAYSPLTRVDARRMFETGVLSEEEYYNSMLDVGYSPENARRFVDWVKADKASADKDLSISQSKEAWKLGIYSDEKFSSELVKAGYDTQEAQTLIAIERQADINKLLDKRITLLVRKYVYQLSDKAALRDGLADLGLQSERSEEIITNAEIERLNKRKLPSRANLDSFLKKGLISESEYIQRMAQIGYVEEDARLFMQAVFYEEETTEEE